MQTQATDAVGSCIIATTNAYAALGGVDLSRLEVALEGDLDLHGIFGLGPEVMPGLGELRATVTLAGNVEEETLREIAARGIRYSPIRDSVEHGTPIRPQIVVA